MRKYTKRSNVKKQQPRKDNDSKRVNFDNERASDFNKKFERRKGKPKAMKDDVTSDRTCAANDISWYSRNPELLQASAGSVVFSSTTGQRIPYDGLPTIPGILTLRWNPSIGPGNIHAVQQAQESIYSYVVHANSRNQSYDSVDLMQMILGTANLFSWIAYGIRAYGTLKKFDGTNYYLPQALLRAQGFNYDDLKRNQANFWYYLNQIIAESAQLWIPKDLPFVARWFWLNSNIYMDSESSKGQMYMFVPDMPLYYNPTFSDVGAALDIPTETYLRDRYTSGNGLTLDQYMTITDKLIESYLSVQDRGIMLGDVLKAYGAENIYAISEIPSDYMVPIVYDKEVLTQIENSTAVRQIATPISQTPNGQLVSTAAIAAWQSYTPTTRAQLYEFSMLPTNLMLNFHFPGQPTAADIMIATRLQAIGYTNEISSTGMVKGSPVTHGTELINQYQLWFYNANNSLNYFDFVSIQAYFSSSGASSDSDLTSLRARVTTNTKWMVIQSLLATFDWAPFIYRVEMSQSLERSQTVGSKTYITIKDNAPAVEFSICVSTSLS